MKSFIQSRRRQRGLFLPIRREAIVHRPGAINKSKTKTSTSIAIGKGL